MPWLLITHGAQDNLRLLVHVRPKDVLCWGTDDHRTAGALRHLLASRHFTRLAERYRRMRELPSPLRAALVHVIARASDDAADSDRLPVHTIREFAECLHRWEDALATAARRHGVDLRGIIQWALTLWAIQAHERGGTWETIALRLDYSSVSGLSDLFLRTVGTRRSALPHGELAAWFDECERACACTNSNGTGEAVSDLANAEVCGESRLASPSGAYGAARVPPFRGL